MINHTPGPWKTNHDEHDEKYQDIKIKAGHRSIATIWIDDAPVPDYNAEQEANAKLIANAPAMLEALQLAYRKHHMDDPSIGWEELDDKLMTLLCEVMGDAAFVAWLNEVAHIINQKERLQP